MKKHIIVTAIILSVMSPVFAKDMIFDANAQANGLEYLQNFADSENFYQPPQMNTIKDDTSDKSGGNEGMTPLFKKFRIKLTNYIREKDYNHTQKLIQKEKQKAENELELDEQFPEDVNKTRSGVKIFNKNKELNEDDAQTVKLEGGVREQKVATDVQLDADNIDFDDNTMDIIATGSPVLYFPPQNTTIKSKKMVYNHASNILKAYEDVEIIRDGNTIIGDYLEINMNEENSFLDNVRTQTAVLKVTARNSEMDDKRIVLYDGVLESDENDILDIRSSMIGGTEFENMIIPEDEKSSITEIAGETPLDVHAKEIIIDAKKNNDTITLKKAKINYGGVDLYTIPSITVHTNKTHDYFEGNYPEFGSKSRLGSYIGPGIVFDTPLQDGSTIKFIPIVNMRSLTNFGFGGLAKYRSGTNYTDFGYGTSHNTFILSGRQKLDDKLYLQYGMNQYLDEWFLGRRMPKYDAELIYHDEANVPSTLGKNLDLRFRHRVGLGYMKDNDENRSDEHFAKSDTSTLRTRYMAEITQDLYKYENRENQTALNLALVMQGSAAVYGTGDTQFVGRLGGQINTQYKRWVQSITYLASAYDDNTPMPMYDAYRFGHSTLTIREGLRLHKYLTIAWAGTANLTNDVPSDHALLENIFLLMIGPDDFKIHLGYDWFRQETYVACVIRMNTKGSKISYDKMTIKNPDRLAKSDKKDVELKTFGEPEPEFKNKYKRMMYAEVRDIEDPDKEQI